MQTLAFAAGDYQRDRGRWPELAELLAVDASLPQQDPWWHAFRIDARAGEFVVRSAGIDGRFDTADDVVSDAIKAVGSAR